MLPSLDENTEVRFEGHPAEKQMVVVAKHLGDDAAELVRRVRVLKWLALMRSSEQSPALREHLLATHEQLGSAETHFFTIKAYVEAELHFAGQMKELCWQVREQRRRWRCLQLAWQRRASAGQPNDSSSAVSTPGVLQEVNSAHDQREDRDGVESGTLRQGRHRSLAPSTAQGTCAVPSMAPVEEAELQRVPSYIRGRVTLERIQKALEDIENILRHKYMLLRRPKHELTSAQLDQRCRYEDMETEETRGQYFFAEPDIKSCASLKQDTTGKALINVLRHLGRVRESRAATHCRIWIVSVGLS
ncbi:hypothetical protein CCYA_CCYA11G3155 [Cyanidiococcus yangmingshanensis]|nr:hypothetical protein CCYA_CCYA11G3155 [Cyanidiococcus yangmingshanensis]